MISVSMRGACALVACLSLWSGVMAAQVDTGGKVVYVDDGFPESADYDDNYLLIALPVR